MVTRPGVLAWSCLILATPYGWASQQLTILHTSEHHGTVLPLAVSDTKWVGGMARRATVIQAIRSEEPSVLLVDSGDILIGTALSSWFRGEPDIRAMNLMGYQAMTAGNHDFDFGFSHLRRLQTLAGFPILCTNLRSHDGPLPCQPFVLVRKGQFTIGVLGIVGRSNYPETFNRDVVRALDMQDPIESVRYQARLWKEGNAVDLVLVISHQNTDEDVRLLKEVEEFDVLIGGHTEGFDGIITPDGLQSTGVVHNPRRVFVKTHRQGRTLGRLDLRIEKGRVISAQARNVPIDLDVKPDSAVQALTDAYQKQFAGEANTIVGHSLVRLSGGHELIRTEETNLGNLLADLLRSEFETDIAVVNSGQIRGSLPQGPVTLGDLLAALPFDSPVVSLELTGKQLVEALENSVRLFQHQSGRFLQVSGLRVKYDVSLPSGSRVIAVSIGNKPVNPGRRYSVATDAFLADGGDGYTMFQDAGNRVDHQTLIRDVVVQAMKRGPVMAKIDHRIQVANPTVRPLP